MSDKPEQIVSTNPATGEPLGTVPNHNTATVKAAVEKAKEAFPLWSALPVSKRAGLLLAARDILMHKRDEIAELISKENGKPIIEALAHDIIPILDLMTWAAKKAPKIFKIKKISLGKWNFVGRRSSVEYHPMGVVGIIAPWNFPLSIPLGEVVMALVAGNTVVCKPSEHTPLTGLKMLELFKVAGLPENVFQVITGDGGTGAALVESGCDKICFTGSIPTGKKIMATCAKTLTPVTLELGGKDPMIVFKDANPDLASSAAVWGAFCNSGQVCASIERVYVQEEIFDIFKDLVVKKTKNLRQDTSPYTTIGAMTLESQIKKVHGQIISAIEQGAEVLTGGEHNKAFKNRYQPTVLSNVSPNSSVLTEETFGPVLPLVKFKTEEDAIHLANHSDYGLNAYIWGKDKKRNRRIASQIQAGTVNLNESVFSHALAQTPWGGIKQSGIGRTHGSIGLLDLVHVRHIHENTCVCKKKYFWWYPYGWEKAKLLKSLSTALYGKGWGRFKSALHYFWRLHRTKVD